MSVSQPRGTSNTNDRGSAASRRERKLWLLSPGSGWGGNGIIVPCYRSAQCNNIVDYDSMQVDRIRPGVLHGRYIRSNIRPSCQPCNFLTGIELRERIRRGEILIVAIESDYGNIVLFKEKRTWVASAQQCGRVVAESKNTKQINALADLARQLLGELIAVRTTPVEEKTS